QGSEGAGERCRVVMQARDPGGEPNASVLVVVGLVRDRGYWRVLSVAFLPRTRSLDVSHNETG
ncbi:MAG: hypothetical protein KJ749_12270, partial [Planctomycetes bacterium]|nr:hypothetical protein [Planctomycetota bacterium]